MKAILVGLSVLAASTLSQAQDFTDAKGVAWKRLDETVSFPLNEVRNNCTPACSGRIGTADLAGYTWANRDQVLDLMRQFEPNAPTSGGVSTFFTAQNFAQALGLTYLAHTSFTMDEAAMGYTSSVDASGLPIVGGAMYGHASVTAYGAFELGPETQPSMMPQGVYLFRNGADAPTPTPANCTVNGQVVAHGQSITLYQSASVPFGSTCNSELRTCNNGVLSGSFTSATCTVQAKPAPLPPPSTDTPCTRVKKGKKTVCK